MSDRIRVLALDLEGTLISSAVSQFPRPGLHAFVAWALATFERVVVFTSVREGLARKILTTLVEYGDVPEAAANLPIVAWSGALKDLSFVPEAAVSEVVLVDDQERVIVASQRGQWVPIVEWDEPYSASDSELERVRGVLQSRLDESVSGGIV